MKTGDRVVLRANDEEDWPREEGVVEEVYVAGKSHGDETFLIVRVDEPYRQVLADGDSVDDGLREVMIDQVEESEKR